MLGQLVNLMLVKGHKVLYQLILNRGSDKERVLNVRSDKELLVKVSDEDISLYVSFGDKTIGWYLT